MVQFASYFSSYKWSYCFNIGWKNVQTMLRLCWGHTQLKDRNIESLFWKSVQTMFNSRNFESHFWENVQTVLRLYWDHSRSNGCKIEPYFWENVQTLLRLSWDHVRSNGPNIKPHFLRECSEQCWDYAKTISSRSNGGSIVPTSAERMFGQCSWTMLRPCRVKLSQHCFHLCWAKVQIMLRPLISNRSSRDNIDSVFSERMFKQC